MKLPAASERGIQKIMIKSKKGVRGMAGALFLFIGKVGRRKETVGGCLRGSAVKKSLPPYPTEQFEQAMHKAI